MVSLTSNPWPVGKQQLDWSLDASFVFSNPIGSSSNSVNAYNFNISDKNGLYIQVIQK